MDKVKKIALILLIWLLTIFFISLVQTWPIPILINSAAVFQIPIVYWLIILVSPFLLYLIAKDSKNPLVPQLCVILYFFLFYSIGLYFISNPTISDISSSARVQEILSSITHIGYQEFDTERFISTARYFQWPIYFLFSKMFSSILGTGSILTLNLGFFSLLFVLPVLLSLFYKRTKNVEHTTVYFILPALYLTLGWHFINSQFVPQFLALIYLFILFGCYLRYKNRKDPLFLFLMVIFYSLTVFSHPFMFIFFLVAIICELYWSEYVEMKRAAHISYGFILILFAMLFPFIGIFYEMARSAIGGESWTIFQKFLSQGGTGGSGQQPQILYHLVPRLFDQLMSSFVTVAMAVIFSLGSIGILFYALKIFKKRDLFDINILIGSASWFVLGLANLVLGQRAIQVAALPLARHFNHHNKLSSYISKVVVVIILIAPLLFIANDTINLSVDGGRLIQDNEEIIAGRFMDKHLTNESVVLATQNPYPTGYPSGFQTVGLTLEGISGFKLEMVDIILSTPKLQKRRMYLNTPLPKSPYDFVIYDNKDIKIISLYK